MQDLEYLIQILRFCEKELTKVVPGGVVGASTEMLPNARFRVFNSNLKV